MEITRLDINIAKSNLQGLIYEGRLRNQSRLQMDSNDAKKIEKKQAEVAVKIENPLPYKAILAVDENNNVIVKILDSDGKVVRQIPPEEYIKMTDAWKENLKTILHMEV